MEKITYGAPRLVDWVAQIKAGAATVKVHFTGGALTAYGVTPAEYTTACPFIQKVIENSSYFKEGRITVLRRSTIKEPKELASKAKPAPLLKVDEPVAETPRLAETPVEVEVQETTANLTKVEATCLQDAQAYLQEEFNISSYKVRSYEAAQRAAAEHGIQFTGAKFDALNGSDKSENETE